MRIPPSPEGSGVSPAHIAALRAPQPAVPARPGTSPWHAPVLLRARLAAGETVRVGALDFRGYWTGAAAEHIEALKERLPCVSWVRLGGPGAPWTREVLGQCVRRAQSTGGQP